MMKKQIAFSYIRFSSSIQAKGNSYKRQLELAEKWCETNGYTLSDLAFKDLGVSAWSGANTNEDSGLSQFITAYEQNQIPTNSVLLIESLDRLSRAIPVDAMQQFTTLLKMGVVIVTLDDNRKYTRASTGGDLIPAQIYLERAHNESQIKSTRSKDNWNRKRSDPMNTTKTKACPFWLSVSEDKKRYTLNDKSELIQRIFEMRSKGLGNVRIAKALNAESIPSAKGKLWSFVTINSILKNRAVLGEYQPHVGSGNNRTPIGEVIPNYYPACISESLFNKVQVLIRQAATKVKQGGSTSTNRNILYSVGKCACCGAKLVAETKRQCVYIRCKNSKVSDECNNGSMRLDLFYDLLRLYFTRHISINSWASSTTDASTDPKREALELQIANRQRKVVEAAKLLEESPELKLSTDKTLLDLQNELKVMVSSVKLNSDLSRVESKERLLSLLELAQNTENKPDNVEARIKIKAILDTFHSIEMHYSDYTATIVIRDLEWSYAKFQSIRGASSSKASDKWNHVI